jgi:hypothetical protein
MSTKCFSDNTVVVEAFLSKDGRQKMFSRFWGKICNFETKYGNNYFC